MYYKQKNLIGNIEQMVSDKLIQGNYNPVIARQNNPKLQEAYTKNQESALTFETHMISQIVNGTLGSVEDGLDSESLAIAAVTSLNGVMQSCVDEADKKIKQLSMKFQQLLIPKIYHLKIKKEN